MYAEISQCIELHIQKISGLHATKMNRGLPLSTRKYMIAYGQTFRQEYNLVDC